MSALHAYRALLRAAQAAFQGDSKLLLASHREIRTQFERNLDPGGMDNKDEKVKHAFEVAKFLKQNVVQAEKVDGQEKFRLRLHEETERGDNESIKTPLKGRVGKFERCS
ncbi:Mitochondrial zinc maintenance protein 1, mitochondrial [Orbilia oligospora]|uniref:Mitochondrial zinc maintenance protein 1, mitochondrial n=1 Tax=Orbilia oligospora TaxID=2813651 RepID=A0A7C8JG99_ORBOL|nr:Mitochondrial zinc maintenance protein 1, mitochondrial [Orbilia oligospora]KAF3082840.1 Mitochondrial zinc maintenance protein 1, mitochondrial [Orbilia oligospora]KAF3083676.1 Mitochondrial zinc maintenance protein 1, mitochondrial [Orbilia oligospora]KAF3119078.1 Mitochondrial zinc maintenance protein 1, mitochondrial [Orbilia oligospora]KAF3121639.1 Mitochondrial zinc maintenance protein 1, mitochondrial [Orbilia oligospora]